ncbi:MAG: zinc ribbon domain-containing protein [Gammaproteobacteria bacterium]
MPIYEYQCSACGHQLEVLQKISDAPPVQCPECNAATLRRMVSATSFQLKGSGWYQSDFKGGASRPAETDKSASGAEAETKTTPTKEAAVETKDTKPKTATPDAA